MRRILSLFAVSLCAVVFAGCSKKEESAEVPNVDPQELSVTAPQEPVAIAAPSATEQADPVTVSAPAATSVATPAPVAPETTASAETEPINLVSQDVVTPAALVSASDTTGDQKQPVSAPMVVQETVDGLNEASADVANAAQNVQAGAQAVKQGQ